MWSSPPKFAEVCVLGVLLLAAGCVAQSTRDIATQNSEDEFADSPTSVANFGHSTRGLQCLALPKTNIVDQGTPLTVSVRLLANPANLPAGIRHLNGFLHDAFLKLVLTNRATGKVLSVKPYDPTRGMISNDRGNEVTKLDGKSHVEWTVSFPLATLREDFDPGRYECHVEFEVPEGKSRWWMGTDADWAALGCWSGTINSAPFELKVVPQPSTIRTFEFPRRLRVEKGINGKPEVVFRKRDAKKVKLTVRNGFFLGAEYYRDGDRFEQAGPPEPSDVNYFDWLYDYRGGQIKGTYFIKVFETADVPEHMWHPNPGSGGYNVLWTNTYKVEMSEREFRKLPWNGRGR